MSEPDAPNDDRSDAAPAADDLDAARKPRGGAKPAKRTGWDDEPSVDAPAAKPAPKPTPESATKPTTKPETKAARDAVSPKAEAALPSAKRAREAKADASAQRSSPRKAATKVTDATDAPAHEGQLDDATHAKGTVDDAADADAEPKIRSPFAFLFGGRPLRIKRGGITFAIGALGAFLLMARDAQWRWSVPLGFVFILVAAIGALDFVGSFDDLVPWRQGERRFDAGDKKTPVGFGGRLWRTLTSTSDQATTLPPAVVNARSFDASAALLPAAGTLAALLTTMTLMSYAAGIGWGIAITIGWIATCALGFKTLAAIGVVDESERPLYKRHGFWLIVFCCVLYLPTLGAHSLVDPWETHYGEVSRDVLSRDDWITIWWAEEGYFLSKPILDFWMQALAMATFGVHFLPGQMIAPSPGGLPTHPEWIVRLPSLMLSVVALYLAYRAVAQVWGRRAGLIGAVVLATMGDWFMLSHESITDMPFVASLTAAMSLIIIGVTTDDEKTVRATPVRFFGRTFTISGYHLAIGVILILTLPQAMYLISRNLTFVTQGSFGFEPHLDEYRTGSGHECWQNPSVGETFERLMRIGKWPCELGKVAHLDFQPWVQGVLWLGVLSIFLAFNRNERRISRLCFMIAWVFAAISTMGKGIAGFLLPIAVAGCYVVAARKWRDVLRFELVSGVIVLAIVAAPWFVAMYARMGDEFIQQLFIHHMWKRALDHVHDTNTGDDVSLRYYVWQLGYAMFPWTGLVPAGLVWWARTRWGQVQKALAVEDQRKRDIGIFLVMWFVFAWALFTYMKTKFHHYVFPAVPPAALLTGIFLDQAIGDRKLLPSGGPARIAAWVAVTLSGVALCVYGLSRMAPGKFWGFLSLPSTVATPVDVEKWVSENHPAAPVIGVLLAIAGVVIAIGAARITGSDDDASEGAPDSKRAPSDEAGVPVRAMAIGALALAGAFTALLITRDLASRPAGDIKGQERLIQLFTYRYDRVWPKELWFSSALLGFGLTVTALTLVLVVKAFRRQTIVAITAVSALYAAYTLDVYMMRVAPHWGQRPLFEKYYIDRRSDQEPLVAFEMNWKGENFYSGGRLVEFGNGMSQGATAGERGSDRLRTWLIDMKKHTNAVYFVTEAGRVSKIDEFLRGVLGPPPNGAQRWTVPITSDADDNKFMVVRARFDGT